MLKENYILISLMPNPKTEAKPTEESKNLFTLPLLPNGQELKAWVWGRYSYNSQKIRQRKELATLLKVFT